MFPFTLHQLRILKAVAIEQSFTKAAGLLYLSQPSLSKHITILENNLGVRLINRQTHKISLTQNGKVFLKYSERILALCEESCRALTKNEKKEQEELKIGTNQLLGYYFFPKLFGLSNQGFQHINANIKIDSTERVANQILSQKLDLALTSIEIYDFLNENSKIKIEYYMNDPFYLIISTSHPFAKRGTINKNDLYSLDYITLNPNNPAINYLNKILRFNQIDISQFKTILYLDSLESIKTAVKLGLGATFLSSLLIEKDYELALIKIIKIHKIQVNQKLFIINTFNCLDLQTLKLFYTKLLRLKNKKTLTT